MAIIKQGDVQESLSHAEINSCEEDNQGQLVYYSGIFRWKDGTFHDEAEVEMEDDPLAL